MYFWTSGHCLPFPSLPLLPHPVALLNPCDFTGPRCLSTPQGESSLEPPGQPLFSWDSESIEVYLWPSKVAAAKIERPVSVAGERCRGLGETDGARGQNRRPEGGARESSRWDVLQTAFCALPCAFAAALMPLALITRAALSPQKIVPWGAMRLRLLSQNCAHRR